MLARRPGLPLHIRTAAPQWLFDLTVRGEVHLDVVDTDPGVVQHDSLSLDAAETVRRARLPWPELLAEMVPDATARAAILNTLGIRPPPE